jgi:hypothetical protein
MARRDVPELQVIGGFLMLAALFVLREFASGALKQAGEEFWLWLRRRAAGTARASQRANGSATRRQAEEGGRGSGCDTRGADADAGRSPSLRILGRGDAHGAAPRRLPAHGNAVPQSARKSAWGGA